MAKIMCILTLLMIFLLISTGIPNGKAQCVEPEEPIETPPTNICHTEDGQRLCDIACFNMPLYIRGECDTEKVCHCYICPEIPNGEPPAQCVESEEPIETLPTNVCDIVDGQSSCDLTCFNLPGYIRGECDTEKVCHCYSCPWIPNKDQCVEPEEPIEPLPTNVCDKVGGQSLCDTDCFKIGGYIRGECDTEKVCHCYSCPA